MSIVTEPVQRALEAAAAELPPNLLYAPEFNMEFTTAITPEEPDTQASLDALREAITELAAIVPTIEASVTSEMLLDMARTIVVTREAIEARYPMYQADHMGRDWYCYCSPGRGEYFSGQGAFGSGGGAADFHMWYAPEPVATAEMVGIFQQTTETWLPPVPEEPSKELAVIPKVELDPVEVIPAPKRSLAQRVLSGVMSFLF